MTSELDIIKAATQQLGYTFDDSQLLIKAVTHKSFANEAAAGDNVGHNERLEFLGDAVLGLIVSEKLMDSHPDVSEGELSRLRAALVNELQLSKAARDLALGQLLRLGRGEEHSGGRNKTSILADLYEAILGAIYLDGGLNEARKFIFQSIADQIETVEVGSSGFDPKSRLQENFQRQGEKPPSYEVISTEGLDHCRSFTVCVKVNSVELGRGVGRSKKEAEQAAAQAALDKLADQDSASSSLEDQAP
ncbi:MAG: ribonuclease III [Deltaproteobacteria bacterium]|nr:ribonuclease III [Deltaproteobacteria bacterium]MBW1873185.1 ribonuclease III [Deltaproteobacteria bacterium]